MDKQHIGNAIIRVYHQIYAFLRILGEGGFYCLTWVISLLLIYCAVIIVI